jgi:hypothetical protein
MNNIVAEQLQVIAENELLVYDAGIRKMVEQPIGEQLMLPDSTKSIRPYCFYKCDGLESVDFPLMIQTVSEGAFEACNGVTCLVIPTDLNIGKKAFANMASLETIHFSGKAKSIHPLAFVGSSVTDIYIPWNEGEVGGAPWGAYDATIHYAITVFIEEDYSSTEFSLSGPEKELTVNGIKYRMNSATGSFETKDKVLVWQIGEADAIISSNLGNIATMYSDRVNYKISLSRNGEQILPRIECRIVIKKSTTGEALTNNVRFPLFKVGTDGGVTLGDTDGVLARLSTEPTAIYISIDFRSGAIEYCDENYNAIATTYITSEQYNGAKANSANELRRCVTDYLLYLHCSKGGSVKVHSIEVSEGEVDYTLLPEECFLSSKVTGDYYPTVYCITKYYGTSPTVIIPKVHNGKTIKGLTVQIFNNKNIKGGQVFLPSTIERIHGRPLAQGGFKEMFVPWGEGEISGAPWGATDATIHYDYDTDVFYK